VGEILMKICPPALRYAKRRFCQFGGGAFSLSFVQTAFAEAFMSNP
jgi:hypothetical protein